MSIIVLAAWLKFPELVFVLTESLGAEVVVVVVFVIFLVFSGDAIYTLLLNILIFSFNNKCISPVVVASLII